jgi:peptidoglycan/xylan/chitin deacetylase (PgdA/CDA1 family)
MGTIVSSVKRAGKLPVTSVLVAGGYARWRRRRLPRDRALILMYHHVTGPAETPDRWWAPFQRGIPLARFERQMRFLRRAMTPVSLRDVVEAVRGERGLPPRAVAVTFDDGYLDNYTAAFPALKRHGIPATVFVSTAFVETGATFWWDQVFAMARATSAPSLDVAPVAAAAGARTPSRVMPLATAACRVEAAEAIIDLVRPLPAERRAAGLAALSARLDVPLAAARRAAPPVMGWDELRDMAGHGVRIESHAHTHPLLGLVPPSVVEGELVTSKRLLEDRLGHSVEGLAYPDGRDGATNEAVRAIARRVGYRFGCMARPGRVGAGADPFVLGRWPAANEPLVVFVWEMLFTFAAH